MSNANDKRTSHKERSKQRREAARRVARGETVEEVANRFGRSLEWAHAACREHGLAGRALTSPDRRPCSLYLILARLFDPALSYADIARELGISRQRVGQVYLLAIEAGIPVPKRPK